MKQILFIFSLIILGTNSASAVILSNSTSASIRIAPSGHMVVDVTINGKYTQPFIIDTGANSVLIPQSLFKQLNLSSDEINLVEAVGGNGSYTVKSFHLNTVKVGDALVENIEGHVSDHPTFIPGFDGVDMGVLPNSFLEKFLTEIDQSLKTITLHNIKRLPSDLYPQRSFTQIPLDIKEGGFIDFPIDFNGYSINSHFDTGAGNSLMVNWKAANKLGFSKDDGKLSILGQAMGTDGNPFDVYGIKDLASISIAGVSYKTRLLVADMSVFELMGDGPRGNLGVGIFKEGKLFINYQSKRIYFSKDI
ncbi:MAG: putative aspartyl protease [Colwellia sp.]|jgi:predicted aspartyl protease